MKKLLTTLLFVIVLVGCQNKHEKQKTITGEHIIKDSLHIKYIIPQRYFLVSYTTKHKNSSDQIIGQFTLECEHFPNQDSLDVVIKDYFNYKNIENIVCLNVYEFRDSIDYLMFTKHGQIK